MLITTPTTDMAKYHFAHNYHEALQHVSMVGNDLDFDTGMATCGKQGQTIHVSVGQPSLRVDRMTVGGQAA